LLVVALPGLVPGWNELRISFQVGLGTDELRFILLLRRFRLG